MSRFQLFTPESRAPSSAWAASLAAASSNNNNEDSDTRGSTPFPGVGYGHQPQRSAFWTKRNYSQPQRQTTMGHAGEQQNSAGSTTRKPYQRRSGNSVNVSSQSNTMPYEQLYQRLNFYYGVVKRQLMRHQDEASGLFRTHDDGATAHVRDNIYCAAALWALSRAYKRLDNDNGRSRELALCCVKTMRRILLLWMDEAHRLENFKNQQAPENAIHCKFFVDSRLMPVPDCDYHHLQIDVVGLYVIFLTQMINSGLDIIFTSDEVNFVQNLVFYLERAYRTPDFGIWERGDKYNTGRAELQASSIGTAKVALECINAFNLFGQRGSSWSVAYVDVDAHSRNRTTLESMLPRESNSKNTDASLLCILSFPVFAVHAANVVNDTFDKVQKNLLGRYGFKRFLRDGYGTDFDRAKKSTAHKSKQKKHGYYEPSEIHNFDGVEPEWPIFFAYLIIDGIFHDDFAQVEHYQTLLEPLLRESYDGDLILPKYYYVPEEFVEAERRRPGSQHRVPSDDAFDDQQQPDGKPAAPTFLWGQAIFIMSQLLVEGLVHKTDLDPLRLHLPSAPRYSSGSTTRYSSFCVAAPQDLAVQVCLISESARLQRMLSTYGIASQTPVQVEPVQIWSPADLTNIYASLGRNEALGLTGRPKRPFGPLSTSKVYRVCGLTVVCYPLFVDIQDFYLSFDIAVLMDDICSSFSFVAHRWSLHGRPTIILLVREDNFSGAQASSMLNLLASLRTGKLNGVNVKLGTLQTFLASSCVEQLDFIDSAFSVKHIVTPLKERTPSDTSDAKALLTSAIFDMVQRGQAPTPESGQALMNRRKSMAQPTAVSLEPQKPPVDCRASEGEIQFLQHQQQVLAGLAKAQQLNNDQLEKWCQQDVGQLLSALRTACSQFSSQAALILCALYRKQGPHLIVDVVRPAASSSAAGTPVTTNVTVQHLLERTIRFAASNGEWLLVRFCSAVLRKVVDSLAPSMSSMLVRGKLVTVGVFAQREIVIDKPITPAELARSIYESCEPHDLTACCVQQEVILNVGKLIEAYPQLFDGIMKIRIGWIIQAMAMYKAFASTPSSRASIEEEDGTASSSNSIVAAANIDNQPPAVVKDLTVKVLCLPFEHQYETRSSIGRAVSPYLSSSNFSGSDILALARQSQAKSGKNQQQMSDDGGGRSTASNSCGDVGESASSLLLRTPLLTPHQRRQIDGCLGRVPERFYEYVWFILLRAAPEGIRIAGSLLSQQPTLTEMSLSELQFALQVDALLDNCMYPAYRQLVVELLLVVKVILERNRECSFATLLDTDQLVLQGLEKFVAANSSAAQQVAADAERGSAVPVAETKKTEIDQHFYASFDAAETPTPGLRRRSSLSRQSSRRFALPGKRKHYNEDPNKFSDDDWQKFYNLPPAVTANYFAAAVANKLLDDLRVGPNRTTEGNVDGKIRAVDLSGGDGAGMLQHSSEGVPPNCAVN